MTDVLKLINVLNRLGRSFYHFTDTRNLAAIRSSGLFSMRRQRDTGMTAAAPGGNEWSLTADLRTGMDKYVHLCFFNEHPMEYLAKKDGRIVMSAFLRIAPEVLATPGALIVNAVSNKSGAEPRPAEEMIKLLDLEVIYNRTNWKEAAIQERLKNAKKYEILIPDSVPLKFLKSIPNG